MISAAGVLVLAACGADDPDQQVVPGVSFAAVSDAAALSSVCTGCHLASADATGIGSLDGLGKAELERLLLSYRDSDGSSPMHRIARGYSEEELRLIADYLATTGGGP